MEKFKVAGIQVDSVVGGEKENIEKALGLIDEAAARDARLVCLPELFNTGYSMSYIKAHVAGIPNEATVSLGEKAKEKGIYITAGIPHKTEEGLFNSAVLFGPAGGIIGKYDKMHLFSIEGLSEIGVFQRGELDASVHETDLCKIGIMVCYDLRFPELARKLALKGADLIVVPSAWPRERIAAFRTLLAARAIENQLYVFGVNRVGKDNQIVFGGNTLLFNPLGKAVGGTAGEKEGVVVAEVDLEKIKETRGTINCFGDRLNNYGL
jgi:predicted amidohydrolase